MFGLKHTFEPYVGANLQCNEATSRRDARRASAIPARAARSSTTADGLPARCDDRSNLMDYCSSDIDQEYLNPCQEERAANQRYAYMTADGETNYWKLKGLAGEPVCEDDPDCEDGRFCDTGTATVGRNQCKVLKVVGQVCTRDGECQTDRCAGLRCAAADECLADTDCADGSTAARVLLGWAGTSAGRGSRSTRRAPATTSARPATARPGGLRTARPAASATPRLP